MTRDDLFTVTHFFHASARHKTEAQYSLDSLAQTIAAESRDAKDLLPWVKLARFANNPSAKGSLRHDANIVSITGGEGDYDAEKMSYDAAIAALSGANVACIVHTSPSHQADKPRWRVLAPASKELPPGDRYRLVARLNGVLGGVLSAESFTLSQSYLYGHLDNGSEYRAIFIEGRCIDQCDDLDVGAIGKPGTKKAGEGNGHGDRYDQPHADRAELIRMIFSGESYHPAARSLLGSYAATGMSKEDALDILHTLGAGQPRYADRWDEIVQLADWVWAKEEAKAKPAATGTTTGKGYPFITADDPLDINKNWVVKGVLALEEISSFIGAPGASKSALLTDIAIHTAIRPAWRSHKIKEPRAVVYWALERGILVRRRILAYRQRDEITGSIPIAIVPRVINLLDKRCAPDIADTVKAVEDHFGMKVGLVVFDTYSKGIAAGGGEENSARDQNIVNANMRRVLELVPIHISGVGHTGKDESRGERGSNAHLADVDMQAMINGNEGIRTATVIKANDQDTGPLTSFAMERIDLGTDPDGGETISTFIVDDNPLPGFVAPKKGRPGVHEAVAFSALQLCIAETGVQTSIRDGGTKIATTIDGWKRYFQMRSVVKTEDPKSFVKAFTRAANKLQASGFVEIWNEKVWIVKE